MITGLQGRLALVTGASRGIGRAIAIGLAEAGADVLLWVESGQVAPAQSVLTSICKAGRAGAVDVVDVSSKASILEGFRDVDRHGRSPDIIVNNAGIIQRKPPEAIEESDWDAVLSVNLSGPIFICQEAASRMAQTGYGKIVNIASVLSFGGGATVATYAISKGGLRAMTAAMAAALAPYGVRVNALAPGHTRTALTEPAWHNLETREFLTARIPLGRWGEPADVVEAAIYLSSPDSDAVTGHVIAVDGGWLAA